MCVCVCECVCVCVCMNCMLMIVMPVWFRISGEGAGGQASDHGDAGARDVVQVR